MELIQHFTFVSINDFLVTNELYFGCFLEQLINFNSSAFPELVFLMSLILLIFHYLRMTDSRRVNFSIKQINISINLPSRLKKSYN